MLAIVALAMPVRGVGVDDNPPGFFTDEASAGYNAYTILKSGHDQHGESWPLLFRSVGDYKLPVFIYSTVPLVAVLGLTETAVRLTSATYGTLAVLATFFFASVVFRDRWVGVAAAFFLAILPWHIHYSRTGFGEMVSFLPFLVLAVTLFLLGLRHNKLWPLAAIVLGLTLYTYRAAWVVVPPLALFLGLLYFRELFKGWRMAAPALVIFVLLCVPLLIHLRSDTQDRSELAGVVKVNAADLNTLKNLGEWETLKTFADQYWSHFSFAFLFEEGDNGPITRHYLPGSGLLFKWQLPLLALGTIGLLIRPRRSTVLVLGLVALYPVAGALSDSSPISSRNILGSVVFSMIAAYGLVLLVNSILKLRSPYGQYAAGGLLVVAGIVVGTSFYSYLDRYHSEYPKLAAGYWGWQSGPREIIAYFESTEDQYDPLWMDGMFNAPGEFLSFYAPDGCKKCTIGNTTSYDPTKEQLFALRPENLAAEYTYRTVRTIEYPNGERAFSFVEITGERETSPVP